MEGKSVTHQSLFNINILVAEEGDTALKLSVSM